ncbi:hypothetical protein ACIBQX_16850 [Nonomuraea sp. NPDC049714]|uniref:hypothetical protein n=1 Tax=Nonomuraea sp. NPDC049714 TaxID=3364357 RepID=UPI0037A6EEEB
MNTPASPLIDRARRVTRAIPQAVACRRTAAHIWVWTPSPVPPESISAGAIWSARFGGPDPRTMRVRTAAGFVSDVGQR